MSWLFRFISISVFIFGFLGPLTQASILRSNPTQAEIRSRLELLKSGHHRVRAVLQSELGTLLYREGRPREAAVEFEKALESDTNRALRRHIYLYLGKSYESSGRIEKAISAYEQAAYYDPGNWKRHRDLGGLYERAQLYSEAVVSYLKALDINPKEGSLHLSMGRTRRKQGLYKEAAAALSKSIEWGADSKEACRELSLVYEGQNLFESAAAACSRGMGESPSAGEWARLTYLAALAGDNGTVNRGLTQLASLSVPKEVLDFYEDLVQFLNESPKNILSVRTQNQEIRRILSSLIIKETK